MNKLVFFYVCRNHHPSGHIPHSRLSRSATHSTVGDVPDIVEVDEEGDIENIEVRPENDADQKVCMSLKNKRLSDICFDFPAKHT